MLAGMDPSTTGREWPVHMQPERESDCDRLYIGVGPDYRLR
jgi:hypothetical protein